MQTQYITDTKGNKISAVLPIKEYQQMLQQLDELACIKAYDKARAKKGLEFVPLKQMIHEVEQKRK